MNQKAEQVYLKREDSVASKKKVCKLDELKTIGVLGRGGFGLVSLVVDPNTKEAYALKAIKKFQVIETGTQTYIVNEKDVMQRMDNPFLVNLCATYQDKTSLYFLLEVCQGGELFTILRNEKYFPEQTARFYAACVIEAFDYMHSKDIIYRDLKPENLVLHKTGYLKVTDFGFAKYCPDLTYTFCGTPDYLAPEVISGEGHGKGVDWWTLGILIYEMLSSVPPFADDDQVKTAQKIMREPVRFSNLAFSKESKTLIMNLLRKKATRRLGVIRGGASNIRKHH
eukprot:UN25559